MKIRCILFAVFVCTLSVFAQGQIDHVPGQAIVRFAEPTSLEQAKQELDPSVFLVDRVLVKRLDIYLVTFDKQLSIATALELLRGYPVLKWAQADHVLKERLTPNDTQFSSLWNLHQTSDCDVDAPEAWDITTGGTDFNGDDLVVAIVDGGCQLSHPDLAANLWVNALEASGTTGVDDDGNGYIDDVNGWDANNDDGSIPTYAHGTHVSGIAGAVGNNGSQVCGVNWNVKLMEISTNTITSHISIAYGYVVDQKALWWSSGGTEGANLVATNNSFGIDLADCEAGEYPIWNDLYNDMGELGVLSAGATANAHYNIDQTGDVPTGCESPYIIAVTNTTSTDALNSGAGYGATTIDLGAPGTNVLSTYPTSITQTATGTSMATPHVAGAVALMHAAASQSFYNYYQQHPDSASLILKQLMLDAVDPLTSLNGITVSGGRLNLFNAVTAISNYIAPGADEPFLRFVDQTIDDAPTGDNDGRFESDETVDLIITIDNIGIDAVNVLGTLVSNSPEITVINGSASYGDVDSLAVVDNSATPFVIEAAAGLPSDFEASLTLTLTADGDYEVNHSITVYVNERAVVWSEDFESGENGWTHSNITSGFGDQWHLSTMRYTSEDHAWKCGNAVSGVHANLLDAGLLSPGYLIPNSAKLSIMHWIEAEASSMYSDSAYDGGSVEVSTDGVAFTPLAPEGEYTHTYRYGTSSAYTGPNPGAECFSGAYNWANQLFDLAAYAGETVQFRFRFCSDAATANEGWYVDDFKILGEPFIAPVTDLVVWANGSDIELQWSAPSPFVTSYRVYRSTSSDVLPVDSTFIGSSPTPSFTDFDAVNLIDYANYIVIAVY